MAVGNQDDIDGRQFADFGGGGLKAFHHDGDGGDGIAEYGVGDDGLPADAHQQGGVAEPDKAAFAFGGGKEGRPVGVDGGQKFGRAGCLRVGQDFPKRAGQAGRLLLRFGIEEGLRFRVVVVACGVNGMAVGIQAIGR